MWPLSNPINDRSRRRFLTGVSKAAILSWAAWPRCATPPPETVASYLRQSISVKITAEQFQTIVAAQNRLMPSEPHAPGAREGGAACYLRRLLHSGGCDPGEPERIHRGTLRLDALSRAKSGRVFHRNPGVVQDELLREYQSLPQGESWMALILRYTLEALLGDPEHGGNSGEVGWKWLEHHAGWPRPPAALFTEKRGDVAKEVKSR
jgi:gluconate 2-dehydrogenase gamma chain